jgi:hypothetical protein
VAHLTEQEAFGIVRAHLEAAGLRFGAAPPEYTVWHWQEIGIDLFDENKNVAVVNIGWEESNRPFSSRGERFAESIREGFSEQANDMIAGVFYNPGEELGWVEGRRNEATGEIEYLNIPTAREIAAQRPALEENLNAQVQAFIEMLRAEGVLE